MLASFKMILSFTRLLIFLSTSLVLGLSSLTIQPDLYSYGKHAIETKQDDRFVAGIQSQLLLKKSFLPRFEFTVPEAIDLSLTAFTHPLTYITLPYSFLIFLTHSIEARASPLF